MKKKPTMFYIVMILILLAPKQAFTIHIYIVYKWLLFLEHHILVLCHIFLLNMPETSH